MKLSKLDKKIINLVKKKYGSRGNLYKYARTVYRRFYRYGWLDIAFGENKALPPGHWMIKENVAAVAKECKNDGEFKEKYPGAYDSAKRNSYYVEVTAHFVRGRKRHGHWNIKENVAEVALKCKNDGEFKEKHSSAYQSAHRNGWYAEVTAHMDKGTPYGYWNIKENVAAVAKGCKNSIEFKEKYRSAYQSAHRNGWYAEVTAHFVRPPSHRKTSVKCIETGEVFVSQSEAARKMNLEPSRINEVLKGKRKSTGGSSFTYVNEDVEE